MIYNLICQFDDDSSIVDYDPDIIWVCLKIGYIPNYSHLIGIMISKTIGFRGTPFSDTPICWSIPSSPSSIAPGPVAAEDIGADALDDANPCGRGAGPKCYGSSILWKNPETGSKMGHFTYEQYQVVEYLTDNHWDCQQTSRLRVNCCCWRWFLHLTVAISANLRTMDYHYRVPIMSWPYIDTRPRSTDMPPSWPSTKGIGSCLLPLTSVWANATAARCCERNKTQTVQMGVIHSCPKNRQGRSYCEAK